MRKDKQDSDGTADGKHESHEEGQHLGTRSSIEHVEILKAAEP
jgi:hypothetical protein